MLSHFPLFSPKTISWLSECHVLTTTAENSAWSTCNVHNAQTICCSAWKWVHPITSERGLTSLLLQALVCIWTLHWFAANEWVEVLGRRNDCCANIFPTCGQQRNTDHYSSSDVNPITPPAITNCSGGQLPVLLLCYAGRCGSQQDWPDVLVLLWFATQLLHNADWGKEACCLEIFVFF